MKKIIFLLLALLLTSCQPDQPVNLNNNLDTPSNLAESETDSPQSTPTEAVIPPEEEVFEYALQISGEEEIVFDWTTDRCEDENIPDIAPRAFRDASGMVQLTIGHLKTYRMIGPDLNNLESDCSAPVMTSDLDDDPAMFNDGEWIGSLYTTDGETVYAILHSEYRGHLHGSTRPEQCPSGDYLTCLDTALTLAISKDGGNSFQDIAEAPGHLIATLPYTFDDQGVPSGLRQPSNVIQGPDGFFYVYSNISDYPAEEQWVCLMRTDNLDDPSSWRYWDGSDFTGEFLNPYSEDVGSDPEKCAPLDPGDLASSMTDSVTYNTVLEKFILVGMAPHPTTNPNRLLWGVYYSFSDDLIDWSRRRLLIELPMVASVSDPGSELIYAYPVLLDPDSASLNFDTNDDQMYLYASRFNFGGGSLDRDLLRWPVELVEADTVYEIPDWDFDIDGDLEWWWLESHLEEPAVAGGALSMTVTGGDPVMVSPPVEFPARDYQRISITMKVSPGEQTFGEIFFLTDTDFFWDGEKYMTFDVISDGEYHTYEIDMSSLSEWKGLIQQIRIDPVVSEGFQIEIDRITILP